MMSENVMKWLGVASGLLGIGLLLYVLFPIFSYELFSKNEFTNYLSPVPGSENFSLKTEKQDFTKASNWFETDEEVVFEDTNLRFYTLGIPKLGIENATVSVGGENLSDSLIQYPGTALPGKRGNAVIFGHSILPQFFNPKDYLTIFSTLPKMKANDEILINSDGLNYLYRVEDVFEVKPTDIQILEQNTSDSFLTLVTCVPPGHPLRPKRLVVRARLIPLAER